MLLERSASAFVETVSEEIVPGLKRRADYIGRIAEQHPDSSIALANPHRDDPFSCDSCRLAITTPDIDTIEGFGFVRSGGIVEIGSVRLNHAYFATRGPTIVIVDFTFGQFARFLKVTLDDLIASAPHLFIGRVCVGTAEEIDTFLGVRYHPPQDFEDFFWQKGAVGENS
ncbi:hypothetical protein A3D06_00430 [Candidatus Roizmanbacteria bacterium RIFCSPHIGHO2_02_FULL_40_9]|uniref:Uncharacterized protein n=1 Tax=Candidatus Roizmanbacteria bacterium RIFCSPHIGHO2_02_FULL_40_9 TaxID=1802042 RepID=A0A1F7HD51_9BACT|nr:MAG: hypothetical protein A3D06_00430 [Candidatus Roizmanbacteria bacterium RIFCSPHIGHO2_02_FULL_40_9]